jgi:DNA-directed RNA polymerase subunit beta
LPEPSLPDAFKYITKLMQGLCLQVNVLKDDGSVEDINTFSSSEDSSSNKAELTKVTESNYGEGEVTE